MLGSDLVETVDTITDIPLAHKQPQAEEIHIEGAGGRPFLRFGEIVGHPDFDRVCGVEDQAAKEDRAIVGLRAHRSRGFS